MYFSSQSIIALDSQPGSPYAEAEIRKTDKEGEGRKGRATKGGEEK